MDSAPLTLKQIEERACGLFFPNGTSHYGSLQNMSKVVANSAGEVILSFPGDGTIVDYLTANCLYPSLTYLYLRTIYVDSDDEEENVIHRECTPEEKNMNSGTGNGHVGDEGLEVVYSSPSLASLQQVNDAPLPLSTTSHTPLVPLFTNDSDYLTVCPVCFCSNLPGEECLRCKQNEEYDASLRADELKHKEEETVANQNPDSETIPLNQDELRQHRLAYLSRNSSSDYGGPGQFSSLPSSNHRRHSNENLNHAAITPAAEEQENQQEINSSQAQSSSEEVRVIKVHRSRVCKDLISHFQDKDVAADSIVFEIIDDRGKPEKGAGNGVARDVFSLFWKAFGDSMTIGARERVPYVRHDHFISEWQSIGRILVKGYKMLSYFPRFLSKAFIAYCFFGDAVPDPLVLNSFKSYLSVDEEKLVENCLANNDDPHELQSDEVVDFLECFNCRTVLNKDNCQKVITELAKQELIQKPHIMLSCWQPILSSLNDFEPFQSVESLEAFYDSIKPTNKKVLQLLVAQPETNGERDSLKFLQRYIRGLDEQNLGHFLRFTTGADVLIVSQITLSFLKVEGIYKTPVAHTCGPVLELPSTYQDFCELREVFNNILSKSDWHMDVV